MQTRVARLWPLLGVGVGRWERELRIMGAARCLTCAGFFSYSTQLVLTNQLDCKHPGPFLQMRWQVEFSKMAAIRSTTLHFLFKILC